MTRASRFRLFLLSFVIVLGATAVGARLYQLQVAGCDRFRSRAADQHKEEFTVQATRGAILDRRGRELAVSLETRSLFAHPWKVEDKAEAARQLAPVLGVSRRELVRRLNENKPFVWLKRFLEADRAEEVKALDLPIGPDQPFGFETEPRRFYPRGRLGVHVVGYATIDGEGVEGIEQQFDDTLQGDPTVYLALRDAKHGALRQLIRAPERDSVDVVLTLDLVLQHIVERELAGAVKATGARAASGVLLDPSTGQVLALANTPSADPNDYGQAKDSQRRNRAVVDFYEPGSTFKIVPMAAALDHDRVRTNQSIHCENGLFLTRGRRIRDVGRHGWLTPRQIMSKSSNIGIVKVARTLKSDEFAGEISDFGFGLKTGIELPGESAGRVTPRSGWSGYSHDSLSFGQEIGVTALQMSAALGAIANDGVRVEPRVALGTRNGDGRFVRYEAAPSRRLMSVEVARTLRSMLESVVAGGTGSRAGIPGYRLAGKSGTAQVAEKGGYSESHFTASFGGFGPAQQPRLVGLVVLYAADGEQHQGGQVAAPVFGRIMADALRYLRVPADEPQPLTAELENWADALPARARPGGAASDAAGHVPDVRGMNLRDAVAVLGAHGYRANANGSGVVRSQAPAPGAEMQPGRTCELRLARSAG